MVAITNIFIAGALAATVSAYPVAAGQPKVDDVAGVDVVLAPRDLDGDYDFLKRAVSNPVPSLSVLLGQSVDFLRKSAKDLITLNPVLQANDIAQILIDLNVFLLNIENDLIKFTPTSGIAGIAQKLLIQSGLQSLILALTVVVSSLGPTILNHGNVDPAIKAQLNALNINIENISKTISAKGTFGNTGNLLGSLASKVATLLSSI